MRATLARAAGLAAVLLSALAPSLALPAPPAAAGGPTSALLSVPGAGRTASLYYTDPEYAELADLVGVADPTPTEHGSGGHESGPGVTATWLIHDVQVWRVDRIYLGGKDGPWIATQTSIEDPIWDSPVVWHRAADGARLADLLAGLGLGTKASTDTSFDGVAGAPLPDSAVTTQATPSTLAASEPATGRPRWLGSAAWALGGLAGGALLTLAWTRRRAGTEPQEAEQVDPLADGYTEVLAR